MKSMRELFYSHEGNLVHKWDHYFEIYDRYFSKYRGLEPNVLEIGISHGGSLALWSKYFGEGAKLFAVDVNPACRDVAPDATVFIGSQSDADFLTMLSETIPDMDIIIDDGGHTMEQQRLSFEFLYPKVKLGGVYLVEDTHTSYWKEFDGGLLKRNSFVETSKSLIDSLYEAHLPAGSVRSDAITQNINSIAFYDSIVVFEKLERPKPFHLKRGTPILRSFGPTDEPLSSFTSKVRYRAGKWRSRFFGSRNPGTPDSLERDPR